MLLAFLVTGLLGYLLGSIPTGLVLGYVFTGEDIRKRGSGRTGATNVLRTAGLLAAALVVIVDIAKGTVPALVGRFLFDDYGAASFGAALAIVGHVFPVFAGFRGGRGVATAFGAVLGLAPLVGLLLPVAAALVLGLTRIVSVMSIAVTLLAALALIVLAFMGEVPPVAGWFGLFAGPFIIWMHRANIRRLLAGTEPKIGRGGDRPAAG